MSEQTTKIMLSGIIPEQSFNKRLDQCLAEMFPDYSRTKIKEWIESGCVEIDNSVLTIPRTKMKGEEVVNIAAFQEVQVRNQAEDIDINIVYEDDEILIINKPAGLVVHPGAGNSTGTLLNALLAHCPNIDKIPRAGIVHRLDKDTTGLMVVAKTIESQRHLVEQLQSRSMGREYEAVVMGNLIGGGFVDENIGRHPSKRTLMAVRETGKPAVTHYRIIEKFRAHTHLRLKLETGRTHQIRVHMAHIKHPLVGDTQYGGRPRPPKKASEALASCLRNFKRQALHAAQITLQHPSTNELMTWQAEIPQDMVQLINVLKQDVQENPDLMDY
ncbi:23S rRNA pseudouridine(1911/1915/1917) synthase RluD [Glaciecola sp. 1036]|uniref:23S rRNA pseudouridine(1911/1915/1917) synthase RluD n=1 Tax=Alteromonadaceae TaxID=72275 RepID=UPI003D0075CE